MKNVITTAFAGLMLCAAMTQQIPQVKDPKKHPGPIDFRKHPEIIAKVKTAFKRGKIDFHPNKQGK